MRLLVIISSVLVLSTLVTPTYAEDFSQRVISQGTLTLGPNDYYVENITLPQDWDFNYTTLRIDSKIPESQPFFYDIQDKDDAQFNGTRFIDGNGTVLPSYGDLCRIDAENRTSCVGFTDLESIRLYHPDRNGTARYPGDNMYFSKIAFVNLLDENYTFSYVIRPSDKSLLIPLTTSETSPLLWIWAVALPVLVVVRKHKQVAL